MKLFTVFTGTPLTSSCIFSTICSICSIINHTAIVTCSLRTRCVSDLKSTISPSNSTLTQNLNFPQSNGIHCAYNTLKRAVKLIHTETSTQHAFENKSFWNACQRLNRNLQGI
jgi:hypothetical protein